MVYTTGQWECFNFSLFLRFSIIDMQVKNIIITGASGGIGRATALELIKDPQNRLFLISRDKTKLNSIYDEIPGDENRVFLYQFDLVSGDYKVLVDSINEKLSGVDILINNAGALVNKAFAEIDNNDFDRIVSTNFKGPFFLIQHLIPLFNQSAHVVNISSMGGYQGSVKFPGLSLYSSSKGALSILTECLALELGPLGVSVNCLALGSVQTTMLEEAFPGYVAQVTCNSMAEYIAQFAVNGNKWLNGKILPVSLSTP